MESAANKIIRFIQRTVKDKSVVLGLSGGLDSSVSAYLAVKALGKNRVYGLLMPTQTNSKQDIKFAELVANLLEIEHEVISLDEIVTSFLKTEKFKDKKSIGNLKARVRMSILYGMANEKKCLVLGTGNKSEILTGYYTKYGDSGADLLPLGDLYKTQVIELAKYLGVPEAIINRAPTAGLWPGQTDEKELGITYKKLDKYLDAYTKNRKIKNKDFNLVSNYIINSAHKRRMPPICFFSRRVRS
jgi:NAD+ synthase